MGYYPNTLIFNTKTKTIAKTTTISCTIQSLAKVGINFLKIWSQRNDTKNTNKASATKSPLNSEFAGANNQLLLMIRLAATIILNADTMLNGVNRNFNLLTVLRFRYIISHYIFFLLQDIVFSFRETPHKVGIFFPLLGIDFPSYCLFFLIWCLFNKYINRKRLFGIFCLISFSIFRLQICSIRKANLIGNRFTFVILKIG